jgi:uncharacterized delta-60 repeat protein
MGRRLAWQVQGDFEAGASVRSQGMNPGLVRRSHLLLAFVVLLAGAFLSMSGQAAADPGDLDPSFGGTGIVTASDESSASDVAIQPDSKIVTAGGEAICTGSGEDLLCHSEFLVRRYNADGSLDMSFGGGDGQVTTNFGADSQGASSVLIEASGKILVGGTTYDEATEGRGFALARFNEDGSLDMPFGGGDGKVTVSVTSPETLRMWPGSMVLQPGGKAVLGGDVRIVEELSPGFNEYVHHPVLIRINADGSLDNSFGSSGVDIGPRMSLFGLAVDASGKLLGAGRAGIDFAVARFNADGGLDASFAGDGIASMKLGSGGSQADDVLVQPDGRIVAAGFGFGYAVARFNEDGTPDPNFGGGDGVTMTDFQQPCCGLGAAISVARQADGRLVFAGQWTPDEDTFNDEWGIGRLYSTGKADPSFGDGGLVTENFGAASSGNDASRVAIQPDGKIVAVGSTGAPNDDFAMLRLMGGGNAPQPGAHHLLITKTGSGIKSIVVGPDRLNCGGNCGVDYEEGETVTVDAFAEEDEVFAGWSTISGNPGSCTGTTSPCEVTLSSNVELQAQFNAGPPPPDLHTLKVTIMGTIPGEVAVAPSGVTCTQISTLPSVICSYQIASGTQVRLTATALGDGSAFAGWAGNCAGTGACEFAMNGDKAVTATFAAKSSGGGEVPGGGGGGGSTSTPPPASPGPAAPAAIAKPKPRKVLKCRKGFKKQTAHGKAKCVKKRSHR